MKMLRTLPRSTARGLLVLLALYIPSMAQEIPTQELGQIIDYAKLSAAVYDATIMQSNDWRRIDGGEMWSGLKWAVYERKTASGTSERVLAFAGTEDLRDWATNIDQAFQEDRFSVPALQYLEALRIATQSVQALDRDKHVPLVIVGHSLGGGLAQYTALKLGTKAVVFNAAALGPETVQDIAPHIREAAGRNCIHIHMRGDPVHEPTRSFLNGKHYGTEHLLEPALGTPRVLPIIIPWLAFVSPRDFGEDKLARHDIKNVIAALEYQQAYGEIQKQVLQSQTRRSGPSLFQGVQEQIIRETQAGERFAVPRRAAEHLAATVQTMSNAVRELDLLSKTNNTLLKRLLDPGDDRLLKKLGHVDALYRMAMAMEQDIALAGEGRYVFLRSHTLEETARVALDYLPDFVEVLQKHNVLRKSFQLPPTFGVVEGLTGAARHIGAGKMEVETITYYLDGLNGLAWGMLGLVSSGGNLRVAEVYQSIGSTLAQVLRDTTAPLFTQGFATFRSQQRQTLETMWRTLQESNVHRNGQIQTIEKLFGKEALEQNGFTQAHIEKLNNDAEKYEQKQLAIQRALRSTKPAALPLDRFSPSHPKEERTPRGKKECEDGACPPLNTHYSNGGDDGGGGGGPGHSQRDPQSTSPAGVHMAPQPEKVGPAGDEMRKAVIDSRPSQESLLWKIELPKK